MAYAATAIQVMIASPGDVATERQIVREVIAEWNALHSRERAIALMPVGWETHTSPELGGRAQELINERLLAHTDLLVGIFWTRVGSPTGKAISGSVEEIERHMDQGKPVMLYFSDVPVRAGSYDNAQYEALLQFKAWAMEHGLVEHFDSAEEFRSKFSRHLPTALIENPYLRAQGSPPTTVEVTPAPAPSLRPEAVKLLKAAAQDDGRILVLEWLNGSNIQAGHIAFGDGNRREYARWKASLDQLVQWELVEPRGYEGEVFEVTDAGYAYVETLAA